MLDPYSLQLDIHGRYPSSDPSASQAQRLLFTLSHNMAIGTLGTETLWYMFWFMTVSMGLWSLSMVTNHDLFLMFP